jgi:hypothetical protein
MINRQSDWRDFCLCRQLHEDDWRDRILLGQYEGTGIEFLYYIFHFANKNRLDPVNRRNNLFLSGK